MEGFKYSQLVAEVERREKEARWRTQNALQELLNDCYATFVHIGLKIICVRSKGVDIYSSEKDDAFEGTTTILQYPNNKLYGTLDHFEKKKDRSLVEDYFYFIMQKWPAICAIHEAYKHDLE